MVRIFRDLEEGESVAAWIRMWDIVALGRFENPCRNFSPICYKKRLQIFHLLDFNRYFSSLDDFRIFEQSLLLGLDTIIIIIRPRGFPSPLRDMAAARLVEICLFGQTLEMRGIVSPKTRAHGSRKIRSEEKKTRRTIQKALITDLDLDLSFALSFDQHIPRPS